MPRSTRLAVYGPEYEQLLLRASSAAEGSLLLELESPNVAHSLKSKVYAYFSALRKSGDRPDLTQKADELSITVEGSALKLYRREDSWDARALRSALGLEKGFATGASSEGVIAPPSGLQAALERLDKIRKDK